MYVYLPPSLSLPLSLSLSLSPPLLTVNTVGVMSGCQLAYLTDQGAQARPTRLGAIPDQSKAEGCDQCEPDYRDALQHEGHHFFWGKGSQPHHGYTWLWKRMSIIHNPARLNS